MPGKSFLHRLGNKVKNVNVWSLLSDRGDKRVPREFRNDPPEAGKQVFSFNSNGSSR